MPGVVRLIIERGPAAGQVYEYRRRDLVLVGRSSTCHVRLDQKNGTASRHHFMLDINPPDVLVRDLGSRNGTEINDEVLGGIEAEELPLEKRVKSPWLEVEHGTILQVGSERFRIEIERPPPPPVVAELPDAAPSPARSSDLADYDIGDKLGEGGIAIVYLATRKSDKAEFALKILRSRFVSEERMRAHFLREADVALQLKHPNIIATYEVGTIEQAFYLLMEVCGGGNLHKLIFNLKRPLKLNEARDYMLQITGAMAYAHHAEVEVTLEDGTRKIATGLVHRDIKLENILLTAPPPHGVAKVSDFGLAKAFDTAGLSGMTLGAASGTPQFMPPDQLRNYRFSKPTVDVWSLAATFYLLVTGRYPRHVTKKMDPVRAILTAPIIPILKRKPHLPPDFAEVIDKGLSLDPKARYVDAAEMLIALEAAL